MKRRQLSSWLGWMSIGWLLAICALALVAYGNPVSHQSLDGRTRDLAQQLRCLVCTGESVAESNSDFSIGVRALIRRRLAKGESPDHIKTYLVSRYGNTVLLSPPSSGIGAAAWIVPPMLVLGGMALLATLVTDWRRKGRGPVRTIGAEYIERVRAELAGDARESSAMVSTPEQLLGRKQDMYSALKALEQDHADAAVDPVSFEHARRRYELEAADILQRLDHGQPRVEPAAQTESRPRRWLVAGASVALVSTVIAVILVSTLRERGGGQSATGDAPPPAARTGTPAGPAGVIAAELVARRHPKNVNASLDLGNAYLGANDVASADREFLRAMRLAPGRPEGETMHALILGSAQNRLARALALLRRVEAKHPAYAHAWLVDGLLSARRAPELDRAIASYRRFLTLAPRSTAAPAVRGIVSGLVKARRRRP